MGPWQHGPGDLAFCGNPKMLLFCSGIAVISEKHCHTAQILQLRGYYLSLSTFIVRFPHYSLFSLSVQLNMFVTLALGHRNFFDQQVLGKAIYLHLYLIPWATVLTLAITFLGEKLLSNFNMNNGIYSNTSWTNVFFYCCDSHQLLLWFWNLSL